MAKKVARKTSQTQASKETDAKTPAQKAAISKAKAKGDAVRKKTQTKDPKEGSTPEVEAEAKKKIDEHLKRVEEARAKLEAVQEEVKKLKALEKAEKNAAKAAKNAEKEKLKKEREEKEKQIAAADEAIKKAQADLELTEEWKALVAAKETREKIGPLPKVRKRGGGGRRAVTNGLTPNMVRVLQVMSDGRIRTASEIAVESTIIKGKRLPELVEKACLEELVPEEGQRGKRFKITETGKAELEKALNEED